MIFINNKMKIKQIILSLSIIIVAATLIHSLLPKQEYENNEAIGMEEDMQQREIWMNKMLANPATGIIPYGIRNKEIQFASTLPVQKNVNKTNHMGFWVNKGPNNVGGRTRIVAIDKTNENILIAGAASGGIWRSEDAGANWQKNTSIDTFICTTTITQDTRKGKEKTWYAGTGEYYGGSVPGQYYTGNGILKSTDGGIKWVGIKSTKSNNVVFDNMFDFNHKIAINTAIDSIDVIFVATYGGINRSINGGNSWTTRRGGLTSPVSSWTDVAITSKGIVYATLSGGGPNAGIWRSKDNGNTWANITPSYFNSSTGRVIIAINPLNENQILFAANTPNFGKKSTRFDGEVEWNSLWAYSYITADGAGSNGQWQDRSENIPALGGVFGSYISQAGYCLEVKYKPNDSNIVFLGGTNLYRSNDAFKTASKTTWIGGYKEGTTLPDFKVYTNHHPDQHAVVFYPSNPNKMLSVNDGGIQKTENNLDNNVAWSSLNNGYVTTQFYTVAIDKTSTNDIIIGGLQDNGTLLKPKNTSNWKQPFSYDGSFGFVGANASEYYMSIQQGRVYRLLLDSNYTPIQSARIDCKDAIKKDYQFINPFTPDVENFKRLYIPNGYKIWRNNDVTQIPLHSVLDSTATNTGWEEMSNTFISDTLHEITAITSASNNILYYGTSKGKLFRIRNASTGNPMPEDIRDPSFPKGYINCIATHPTDTAKLFVVFTNYEIVSLYYSNNSGATWQAIAGNLEDNISGSGNGPSCRWFSTATINNKIFYYVATSTGLFATDSLEGNNTNWVRQAPTTIGYNIVTMIDYRNTDGLMAVSTFGAGIFTAILNNQNDNVGIKNVEDNLYTIYPNPVKDILYVKYNTNSQMASFELYNINGQWIKNGILNKEIKVEDLISGIYILKINIDGKIISKKFLKE